jgi:DNA polymerase-4
MTGRIGVKIRRHDFATFTRQRAIAPPTQDSRTVRNVARELLSRWLAEHAGAKLRLLGVVLTDLSPAAQLGLFDTGRQPRAAGESARESARDPRLDSTLDEVRARFGTDALRRGNTIE